MTEYNPKPGPESSFYDSLWKVASPTGLDLSGADAVQFFKKSGENSGILKQIWGLSTPTATMSQKQFYSALRLVTMSQNGDFPLSRGRVMTVLLL